MKTIISIICMLSASAFGQVPFFTDPSYTRDEPVNPPWYVHNNGQPSRLFHYGVFQSQEIGLYDLDLPSAWSIQHTGCTVGVVDMGTHGDRVCALVRIVGRCRVYRHELSRWYAANVASGIIDCANKGCLVIVVCGGYSSPDPALFIALLYASSSVICCAVPDQEGDLDSWLVDYPYAWRLPWVLPVNGLDRSGLPYWSASGTNCVSAPSRNIVACGTYSSGTSWATPIVAGAASLVRFHSPSLSAEEVVSAVRGNGILRPLAALTDLTIENIKTE